MEQRPIHICPIVFCQEILKAEQKRGDSLPSLINIFDGVVLHVPLEDIPVPFEFHLFAKAEITEKLKESYELVFEVFAPSGRKVKSIKGNLERSDTKRDDNTGTGDVMQYIELIIDEDGDYLVTIKFQNKVIGQAKLHFTRKSPFEPSILTGGNL